MQSFFFFMPSDGILPRYEIYRRPTIDGADALYAVVASPSLSYLLTGQAADSSYYYHVKAVSECGVRDVDSVTPRLRRAAFDGDAELIPPVSNVPHSLQLELGAAGNVTLRGRYSAVSAEATLDQVNVYVATGATAFDFEVVDHEVAVRGASFSQDLGAFANGTTVRVVAKSATETGDESAASTEVTIVADAAAPSAPAGSVFEVST